MGGTPFGGMLGGKESKTTTAPGELDIINAEIVSTMAPYIMKNIAADLGGGMTTGKSHEIGSTIQKGITAGATPSMALRGAGGAGMSAGGGTLQQAMMLYGKQPAATPGGGSTSVSPGMQEYAQVVADIKKIYDSFKGPSGSSTAARG